jgi:hypothetical protein
MPIAFRFFKLLWASPRSWHFMPNGSGRWSATLLTRTAVPGQRPSLHRLGEDSRIPSTICQAQIEKLVNAVRNSLPLNLQRAAAYSAKMAHAARASMPAGPCKDNYFLLSIIITPSAPSKGVPSESSPLIVSTISSSSSTSPMTSTRA